MARPQKQRRIRVRGRQRDDIDLDLLVQALIVIAEERVQRQAGAETTDDSSSASPQGPAA